MMFMCPMDAATRNDEIDQLEPKMIVKVKDAPVYVHSAIAYFFKIFVNLGV
jgi:hypothetical protein